MQDIDKNLVEAIVNTIKHLEQSNELVICSSSPQKVTQEIVNVVKEVYAGEIFTPNELFILSQLASEASSNDSMFQGEVEAATGFSKKQMADFAGNLRALSGE